MPRLSHRTLTAVATATLVGAVLLGGGAAWAAWSVSSNGVGASAAESLVTPVLTATTSTSAPTTAIDLSWTADNQLAGAAYSVTRNGSTISCSASPCTDSGLTPNTSYSYVVTAKVGTSWSAASAPKSASTSPTAVSTTTTLQSSQNPAKSAANVTLTATVTAGSGTPTGTVTFSDGGSTLACTGGSARPLSSGSATCQVSSLSIGTHPITATYSGASGFSTSTSNTVNQRIVNANVTGLTFGNVKVNGNAVSPTCSGTGTGTLVCTVSGGNNAAVTADAGFANSTGTPTSYATDAATALPWTSTGKTPSSGSMSVAPGASLSSGGGVTATKNGSNSATITVTFNDGLNSFTATLTVT